MRPAVEIVLDLNLKVELWGWDHAISPVYEGMRRKYKNLKVFDLTPHHRKIGYTAYMSTFNQTHLQAAHAIMIENVENQREERFIIDKIAVLGILFFFYRIPPDSQKEKARDIAIEFPNTPLETVIPKLKEIENLTFISFPEYRKPTSILGQKYTTL